MPCSSLKYPSFGMAIAEGLVQSWVVEGAGAEVAGADGAGFAVAVMGVISRLAWGGCGGLLDQG